MSSSSNAVIIIGLPISCFGEDGIDKAEEYGLDIIFPYYDGGKHALAGFLYIETETDWYSSIHYDDIKVNELKKKFRDLTNLDAKVYLSPNVT